MSKKQFYGIKYPFTNNDESNYFVDINHNEKDKLKSLLLHVLFTPKGQRIRNPNFGTNLIKYIFEPSDKQNWDNIIEEISNSINKYITNITINNISILNQTNNDIYVRVDYSVDNKYEVIEDNLIVKL